MTDWAADEDVDPSSVDYGSAEEAGDESEGEAAKLVYPNVHEWVRGWLRFAYKRKIDGRNTFWAARWWQVDEALMRLEALWRSWEHLRLDPGTGMSVWWRDHADHHMPLLIAPGGPFDGIEGIDAPENTSKKQQPLAHIDAPAWLFPREEDQPATD